MAQRKQVLVGDGLFEEKDGLFSLVGTHCKSCGDYFFPKTFTCHNPDCLDKQVEDVPLSRRGKIWSYSVLHYPPPLPYVASNPFLPVPIIEVEISEQLKIIGMLEGCQPEEVRMGMDVELFIGPLYEDAEGNEIIGWKFKPSHDPA